MTPQKQLALALWANKPLAKEHAYGEYDCFLAFLDMMDYVHGTELMERFKNLYHDRESARRWYKRWALTMPQFLSTHGWTQQDDDYSAIEGDARVETSIYPILYVRHNGHWWTMSDQGWCAFTDLAFRDIQYTTWSRD